MHEKLTTEQKDIAGTMATQGRGWCIAGNVAVSVRVSGGEELRRH